VKEMKMIAHFPHKPKMFFPTQTSIVQWWRRQRTLVKWDPP